MSSSSNNNNNNNNNSNPIRVPPLKLKATRPFPPYEEGSEKVNVEITKRDESMSMNRLRSSWKKFSQDIQTASSDVKASGATINGYLVTPEQVTFLAETFGVRLRDNKHYWYDKESGFFGKMGGLLQRHIDPRLSIKGDLDPRSSSGTTNIFVNGREITTEERKNWKKAGMVLDQQQHGLPKAAASFRYKVDPLGNVFDEATETLLFNWRQQYKDMQNQQLAIGATVVGVALLGGMATEGLLFGGEVAGSEGGALWGGGGGGDALYASDMTGAASNFDSSGAGYISFDDGSSVSIGL